MRKRKEPKQQPPPAPAGLTHADFLHKALVAASEWVRFADPKVLAIFVFLGLGTADLVKSAARLVHAREAANIAGWTATCAFFVACGLAVVTVACASVALFPRLRSRQADVTGGRSLYFFGGIARFNDPASYEREVRAKASTGLETEIAHQVWEVSRIAHTKLLWAQHAYVCVLGFLMLWVIARIALSFL